MMFLAGDVGGTKTVVGLFEAAGAELRLVREQVYSSAAYPSFEAILADFLDQGAAPQLQAACFGVAGPVIDGRSEITNLPWVLDERNLAGAVGARHGKLLNDLEATAYGMLFLRPEDFCVLNPGVHAVHAGNVAVIAAGTGLGEAFLHWDGRHHHPVASEGGHADFSPRTDLEIDLLKYLRARHGGHVSWERILSGPGFYEVYTFLRDSGRFVESAALREQLRQTEPNVVISRLGLDGSDPLCAATVDVFTTLYGVEAGNLALKVVAMGGVYIGGGIAPKLLPALQRGHFMQSFCDKGRLSGMLEEIQVKVALEPRTPLIGAAHYAQRL
jgi:glucokinase